MSLGH